MIGFYVLRGHTLDELLNLSTIEKVIFMAAMNNHNEEIEHILKNREVK